MFTCVYIDIKYLRWSLYLLFHREKCMRLLRIEIIWYVHDCILDPKLLWMDMEKMKEVIELLFIIAY